MATVVDLDEIVKLQAIKVDKIAKNSLFANGSTQNLSYEVDWSHVYVTTEKSVYDFKSADQTSPQSMVLFKSKFNNQSAERQEHSFSAQSKYTSSGSVSLYQCFTLNGRTNVDLSLPDDVLTATSSFGHTLSVTSAGTQTFQNEHIWNVNTKIVVPKNASTTAEQSISETEYSAPFSVDSILSGKVHVRVLDKNGTFVRSVALGHISEIVEQHYSASDPGKPTMPDFVKIEGRSVRVTSEGQCKFTYAIEQHVTVSSN